MRAISCKQPGEFESLDLPDPTPADDEVLLRIRKIGICGTDYHAFRGRQPYFEYPRILGHELAAEVAVDSCGFKAGQAVVALPYIECGTCPACLAGKTNCCPELRVLGVHVDGGMCELLPVRARNVLPVSRQWCRFELLSGDICYQQTGATRAGFPLSVDCVIVTPRHSNLTSATHRIGDEFDTLRWYSSALGLNSEPDFPRQIGTEYSTVNIPKPPCFQPPNRHAPTCPPPPMAA